MVTQYEDIEKLECNLGFKDLTISKALKNYETQPRGNFDGGICKPCNNFTYPLDGTCVKNVYISSDYLPNGLKNKKFTQNPRSTPNLNPKNIYYYDVLPPRNKDGNVIEKKLQEYNILKTKHDGIDKYHCPLNMYKITYNSPDNKNKRTYLTEVCYECENRYQIPRFHYNRNHNKGNLSFNGLPDDRNCWTCIHPSRPNFPNEYEDIPPNSICVEKNDNDNYFQHCVYHN